MQKEIHIQKRKEDVKQAKSSEAPAVPQLTDEQRQQMKKKINEIKGTEEPASKKVKKELSPKESKKPPLTK